MTQPYAPAPPRQLDEILRTLVGSGVHGLAIDGTDDRDEMGIFIESPGWVLGIERTHDDHDPLDPAADPGLHHDIYRTAEAKQRRERHQEARAPRSRPGDLDLTRYSLRKYVRLATQGNPTVLLPLFAPPGDVLIETQLGEQLRALAPAIVSRQAGHRFLGYMQAQRDRLTGGGKRNRVPNRPELVERYGYDVKYASHALRLAMQGVELMETGRLELPMCEDWRARVRAVKTGQVAEGDVLDELHFWETSLKRLLDMPAVSPLPHRPDYPRINAWMVDAHLEHWRIS